MLVNIKAGIVVLALAAAIFHFGRPIALRFMSAEDFSLRRRVWLLLTAVSFLSPSFWLYVLVATPTFIWAGRKDSNPIALYLLSLHLIPPAGVIIPILGNNGLFPLDNHRLLAICVLIPACMRYRKDPKNARSGMFGTMDVLLLALGALEVALYTAPDMPDRAFIPDSISNALRRGVLFLLDDYALFFAVSRLCRSRGKLVDAAASFCLAGTILGAIAIFEQAKGWYLYAELAHEWTDDPVFYLARGSWLRAQASAGHALALGYLLAVAWGFWLYLKAHVPSRAQRAAVVGLLWGGLLATFSRGPWLGAAIVYFVFNAAAPRALSRIVKGAGLSAAVGGLVLLSPLGSPILAMLPVMGKTADFNVTYRERLAERGWEIVFDHPFFGDQFPWPDMADLRQGQGIIDMVNTYIGFALGYGLIGLFCFLGFILLAAIRAFVYARRLVRSDPDLALYGSSLVACIAGVLVMIDSNSFNMGVEKMFFVLAGLAAAYASLQRATQPGSPQPPANEARRA